jgi:hypothetical protein
MWVTTEFSMYWRTHVVTSVCKNNWSELLSSPPLCSCLSGLNISVQSYESQWKKESFQPSILPQTCEDKSVRAAVCVECVVECVWFRISLWSNRGGWVCVWWCGRGPFSYSNLGFMSWNFAPWKGICPSRTLSTRLPSPWDPLTIVVIASSRPHLSLYTHTDAQTHAHAMDAHTHNRCFALKQWTQGWCLYDLRYWCWSFIGITRRWGWEQKCA